LTTPAAEGGGGSSVARLEKVDPARDAGVAGLVDAVTSHYAGRDTTALDWKDAEGALRRAGKRARKQREAMSPLPPLNDY
jgi:hypothetical protein